MYMYTLSWGCSPVSMLFLRPTKGEKQSYKQLVEAPSSEGEAQWRAGRASAAEPKARTGRGQGGEREVAWPF